MLGDQEDGGVEGAADVPETAGFWPAGGSVGMEKASVIVPRSYRAHLKETMILLHETRHNYIKIHVQTQHPDFHQIA